MIEASELEIVGRWITFNGEIRSDEACQRIERLTAEHFVRVANSRTWGDWEILYQDPVDGRYWEKTHPQVEMQGGGPPSLKTLGAAEARSKYGLQ